MKNIDFGLVICNVGGKGSFGYKKSFDDKHFLNDLVQDTFRELKVKPKVYPFDINGSDERQYSFSILESISVQFLKISIMNLKSIIRQRII